ncbi:MAG: DUF1580 domain-containing protein [Planctomycetes bacterium]|nr:DUF1580 domain-containing protein [Planctomycetota bacterium]
MIDLTKEELLTLSEAAGLLPPRRKGKRPHPTTLFRWASNGLRGEKLEVLRVGDTTCTSIAALQRFFRRLTELDDKLRDASRNDAGCDEEGTEGALDELGV